MVKITSMQNNLSSKTVQLLKNGPTLAFWTTLAYIVQSFYITIVVVQDLFSPITVFFWSDLYPIHNVVLTLYCQKKLFQQDKIISKKERSIISDGWRSIEAWLFEKSPESWSLLVATCCIHNISIVKIRDCGPGFEAKNPTRVQSL